MSQVDLDQHDEALERASWQQVCAQLKPNSGTEGTA